MPPPELDDAQRRAATAKAVAVRRARAAVKAELRAGATTIPDVLARAADDEALARMRVSELLEALPGHGPATVRRLLQQLDIAPSRRVQGLGPRQRAALLATFEVTA